MEHLNEQKVRFLGKKGELTAILKGMGKLSAEERPVMGQLANEVRDEINQALERKMAEMKAALQEARLNSETLDVTLPGRALNHGAKHPITMVIEEAILPVYFAWTNYTNGQRSLLGFHGMHLYP